MAESVVTTQIAEEAARMTWLKDAVASTKIFGYINPDLVTPERFLALAEVVKADRADTNPKTHDHAAALASLEELE